METPASGNYSAYFETIDCTCVRMCPFAGGISAVLCDHPEKPLKFTPKEFLIQVFPLRKYDAGTKSEPVATFNISEENLL